MLGGYALDDCRHLTHIVDGLDNESLLGNQQLINGVLRRVPESLEKFYKRYGMVLKSIVMQILNNEGEGLRRLAAGGFFHAIDRYDVPCHSVTASTKLHTMSAKHFVMISVRCCINTGQAAAASATVICLAFFGSQRSSTLHLAP